uniref:Uncharacterized protein n=1 Tax=Arundo donax TaxID=35708 RepID=A0A0A9BLZ4_ARUDO
MLTIVFLHIFIHLFVILSHCHFITSCSNYKTW